MSSSSSFSLDSLSSYEQLCYVHCSFCDTVLAVSVPCSNLFNTVTVRCGHCTNLLSVNMRSLLNHLPLCNSFFPTTLNILEGINPQQPTFGYQQNYSNYSSLSITGEIEEPKITTTSRPTEKRQRVPSAYNRFIKEEIQRIKAMNPEISHREAFSAAAKNWAHFPHIHFGLVPDQNIRRSSMLQQEWETVLKDGPLASSNASVGPF